MNIHLVSDAMSDLFNAPIFCAIPLDMPFIEDLRQAERMRRDNDWSSVTLKRAVYFFDARPQVQPGAMAVFVDRETQDAWNRAEEFPIGPCLGDEADACEMQIPTTRVEVGDNRITIKGRETHSGGIVTARCWPTIDQLCDLLIDPRRAAA